MTKPINKIAAFSVIVAIFAMPIFASADDTFSVAPVVPPVMDSQDGATVQSTPTPPPVMDSQDGATVQSTPTAPPVIDDQTDPSITAPAPTPTTPTTVTTGSSGGFSGFSSGGSGGYVPLAIPAASTTAMIGTTSLECPYLTSYITTDTVNSKSDVTKLQVFLKVFGNSPSLAITGVFDAQTVAAVKAFQTLYFADTMAPWGAASANGEVYITTLHEINQIACGKIKTAPLTAADWTIIAKYRENLTAENAANAQGGQNNQNNQNGLIIPGLTPTVGATSTGSTSGSDIFGVNPNPNNSALTANVTTSGLSSLGHFFSGIFSAIGHFFGRK